MGWTIEYAESARKPLRKLDHETRARIRAFLEDRLAGMEAPRSVGKALKGPLATLWRYRGGDWRIICRIEDRRLVVLVLDIGHRREVHRS